MKKSSIKTSIIVPSLAVLFAGILLMVIIVGAVATSRTNDLSERLVSARVAEYSNEFRTLAAENYSAVQAITPIVESYSVGNGGTGDRAAVYSVLENTLSVNPSMVGLWTCWEPNAFDGDDAAAVGQEGTDESGRMVPYFFQDGSNITLDALVGYDDLVAGDFYQGAKATGKPYVTDPYPYEVAGKSVLIYSITIPILKDGSVVGAVGADITLEQVNNIFNAGSILDDGYLLVLSPSGLLASHRDSNLLLTDYKDSWLKVEEAGVDAVLAGGETYLVQTQSDSGKVLFEASGVQVGDTGRTWAVCGLVPMKTVSEVATALVAIVIGIGVALILIVGLTIFLIVRMQLANLPLLTETAEAMAVGDIHSSEPPKGLDQPTKNEIELLGRAFVKMAAGINEQAELMTHIGDGDYSVQAPVRSEKDVMNIAINHMLDRTNQALESIREASTQVASGADQIADGAQALATGSTEQAATLEEFSATISQIQSQAEENNTLATQTLSDTEEAGRLMNQSIEYMNEMTEAMHTINSSSQEIAKVIKVIDDIAFQTNILALNAAVEAARAGQHGKGFAVVADEVRNLASKSAAAAKETASLIESSVENTRHGTEIVEKTGESLAKVGEIAAGNAASMGELAASSGQQSSAITEINQGISQISSVVQANSATAEESAASAQEMSAQSALLNKSVGQFRLRAQSSALGAAGPQAALPASPPDVVVQDSGEALF